MVSPWLIAQSMVSGILLGCIYALIALGLALIWGVMEIVNFAHGDFLMISMYLIYFIAKSIGMDPLIGSIVGFLACFTLGFVVEKGLIERVLGFPPIVTIMVTFPLLLILRYGALAAFGPDIRTLHPWYFLEILEIGMVRISMAYLMGALISIAATTALFLFLYKTYTGIALRAVAQNRLAASLSGIDVTKMYTLSFAIGSGLVGLAGGILTSFYYIIPEVGYRFCLLSFVIVVLGGFGSLFGSFIGGLIIGVAEEVSAIFIPPAMKDVIAFLIFLLILLFKPSGLFGEEVR
jgi:branched-chain amino acid transport system permease protein